MTNWRTHPYHQRGTLFVRRPEIVFCAAIDAQTFAWSTALQPSGTIRYIYPDQSGIAYGAHYTNSTIESGMLALFGTAPGLDDLGRCRVIGETQVVSGGTYNCIDVWIPNQGTGDGEANITTGDYITIVDDYRVWPKKPFIYSSTGYVYKDGMGTAATQELRPIANAGAWYMNIPSSSAPASVDFDGILDDIVMEDGASLSAYSWDFDDATPGSSSSAAPTGVSFPAGDRWISKNVTDTYHASLDSRALIAIRNVTATQEGFIDKFAIQLRHTRQGQRATVRVFEDLPSGYSYYDELRRNKLTAHYIFNEASGSTIADYSGHGFDATGTSLSSYGQLGADGRYQALGLDGTADYVSNTATAFKDAINQTTGAISIMAKVSGSGVWTDSTVRRLFRLQGSTAYVWVAKNSTNNQLTFSYFDDDSNTATINHTISTTDWFNVLVTWDTTDGISFYVDGTQIGSSGDWAGWDAAPALYVGRDNTAFWYWDGDVQHCAIIDGDMVSSVAELSTPDLRIAWTPRGAAVMYATREVYAGTAGSLSTAGPSDREHMQFCGWMLGETTRHEATDAGGLAYTEFEAGDVGVMLALLENKAFTYERDAAPSTSGTDAFVLINKLNGDRACTAVLTYDSTGLELGDYALSSTSEAYAYPWWRINQPTIYDAVNVTAQKFGHMLTCDKHGRLRLAVDPQLQGTSDISVIESYTADVATSGFAISDSDRAGSSKGGAFANDGSSTYWQTNVSPVTGVAYIGQDFGSGNDKGIRRVRIWQRDLDATSITSVKVQYSDNGSSWSDADTFTIVRSASYQNLDFDDVGEHRYWRLLANSEEINPVGYWACEEIEMLEANLSTVSGRSNTIAARIQPWDITDLSYADLGPERAGWNWGYAVERDTNDADTTPTITALACVAPGPVPGRGAGVQEYDEQVVTGQTELNIREGNRYAVANAQYGQFAVTLAHGGDNGWDAAITNQWVLLGVPSTIAAAHGITFPGPEYHETVLSIAPESLIQYLRLNEPSGTTANDSSPANNDGYYYTYASQANPTYRVHGMGDGYRAVQFGSAQADNLLEPYDSTYAPGLYDDWVGGVFTVACWFKLDASYWDSYLADRTVVAIGADANNYMAIYQSAANTLTWDYTAGSTPKSISKSSISDSDWHFVALTVDINADEMKAWYGTDWGVAQEGSTQISLGVWAGSGLADAYCYAFYNMAAVGAHLMIWSEALTSDQLATLAQPDNRFLVYEVEKVPNAETGAQDIRLLLEREITGVAAHTLS